MFAPSYLPHERWVLVPYLAALAIVIVALLLVRRAFEVVLSCLTRSVLLVAHQDSIAIGGIAEMAGPAVGTTRLRLALARSRSVTPRVYRICSEGAARQKPGEFHDSVPDASRNVLADHRAGCRAGS
jgi:hypothetical protein